MHLESRADNATSGVVPAPVVWSPSGEFNGNDGKWSTFVINIGDDASGSGQNFKILISTSLSLTLVPQQAGWCDSDCAASRGVEIFNSKQPKGFESSSSKAWNEHGQYSISLPYWWFGNTSLAGVWGQDNVGLGQSSKQSLILQEQYVVEYTFDDLYMGSFGLGATATNTGSGPKAPFLINFQNSPGIPSLSYSYTAGAHYQNAGKGVLGSLVLGGYDQSRSKSQNITLNMPSDKNNTLLVGVQSILYHPDRDVEANDFSFTANHSPFYAAIDSTLPYLWLPKEVCDEFESKFQLTYDDDKNMYTVNGSAHDHNTQQNATVDFKLGDTIGNSDNSTTISLPYAAFDLEASSPIFENTTKYFPIRRSPNGINVLGRAFLQEAYIVVDYERSRFTISQAVFSDPMPQAQIVPIFNTTYQPEPTTGPAPSGGGGGGGGLSGGAIAGIVVGIVAFFGLLALGLFLWWKRRRMDHAQEDKISEVDTIQAGEQFKHRRVSELDSEPPNSPKPSVGGYYDRDGKDIQPFPPINEMESPPAELYSPPPESIDGMSSNSGGLDYFSARQKVRRRGATRESSTGQNTPGTPGVAPIAELPGDDGKYTVDGQHFDPVASPTHSRGPSDSSLPSNIDEVIAGKRTESPEKKPMETGEQQQVERRPSHVRGASDTTVKSESTAVSQPTPEELANWDRARDVSPEGGPKRPLSE